jgi:hypothetical protein
MKYMLMMNGPREGFEEYMSWPKEVLEANMAFMHSFTAKLAAAGELVVTEGLASPSEAKLVRAGKDGKPITDGVFPESKEFLAGYWLIDVESAERAYEIAAEASTAPGLPMKSASALWIEVRQVMSGQ